MALFDFETYNEYLNKNDYNSAANYAAHSYFKDNNQKQSMLENIKILRNKSRTQSGIMNQANDTQKQAITFKYAMDNGTDLPKDNQYTKRFQDAINNMFGMEATGIAAEFDTAENKQWGRIPIISNIMDGIGNIIGFKEAGNIDFLVKDEKYSSDACKQFLANMGFGGVDQETAFAKLGLKPQMVNGKYRLIVPKSHPQIYKIMQALYNTDTNHVIGSGNHKLNDNIRGEKRFKLAGVDKDGNIINFADEDSTIDIAASDAYKKNHPIARWIPFMNEQLTINERSKNDGKFINPDYGDRFVFNSDIRKSLNSFSEIADLIDEVEDTENDVLESRRELLKDRMMKTQVVGFLGAGDAKLESDYTAGKIDGETYTKYKNIINDHYENLLSGASLSQYNVFSNFKNDEETDETEHQLETADRTELDTYIKAALHDNRIQFSAAIMGNMSGTQITILPKTDKEGNPIGKTIKCFVENLFQGSVEDSLNRDTKTRAVKELNGMEYYGYSMYVPSLGDDKGGELFCDPDQNPYIINSKGEREDITRADAQSRINKALVLQDLIDGANQTFFDEDGNFVKNKNIELEVGNWAESAIKEFYPATLQRATMLAAQGGDPSQEISFLKNKQGLVYDYILNAIGYFNSQK